LRTTEQRAQFCAHAGEHLAGTETDLDLKRNLHREAVYELHDVIPVCSQTKGPPRERWAVGSVLLDGVLCVSGANSLDGSFVKGFRDHRVNVAVAGAANTPPLDVVVDVGLDLNIAVLRVDRNPSVALKLMEQSVDEMKLIFTAQLFSKSTDVIDLLIDLMAVLRQECCQCFNRFRVLRIKAEGIDDCMVVSPTILATPVLRWSCLGCHSVYAPRK
jgi:hypothetical protein